MEASSVEREVRAARNEALFRTVNEKLKNLNEAIASVTDTFTVACECADTHCIELIEITPGEYQTIRAQSRQFVVLQEHVYSDVEVVIRETEHYAVVEKHGTAGEIAEVLEQETSSSS